MSTTLVWKFFPAPIVLALSAEVIETPGTAWRYNNKAFNLLAGIIQKLSGKPMDVYIMEKLFAPLNITKAKWDRDKNNNAYAFLGCYLKPIDLAKLGLLVLNKGSYDGKKVLSESNLAKIYQTIETKNYGLGWWIDYYPDSNADDNSSTKKIQGIVAAGSYGNIVAIVPDKNIVAVRLISYKTYCTSDDPYFRADERGPTSFGDFQQMVYDMLQ